VRSGNNIKKPVALLNFCGRTQISIQHNNNTTQYNNIAIVGASATPTGKQW